MFFIANRKIIFFRHMLPNYYLKYKWWYMINQMVMVHTLLIWNPNKSVDYSILLVEQLKLVPYCNSDTSGVEGKVFELQILQTFMTTFRIRVGWGFVRFVHALAHSQLKIISVELLYFYGCFVTWESPPPPHIHPQAVY